MSQFINLQKLLRLPVFTESEIRLGRVFDLEIDLDSQVVIRYLVRANFLSPKVFLIANSQVKEIKVDRIVVYDDVLRVGEPEQLASED